MLMTAERDDDERPAGPVKRGTVPTIDPEDSRSYTWYALRAQPQRELSVQRILDDLGFASFVAVSKRWEFPNRAGRGRWEKREVIRPIMPGWVFLGMNAHTPGWARVVWVPLITGIVAQDGRPLPIPHDNRKNAEGKITRYGLKQLMWEQAAGRFNAPDYERWQDTQASFKPGDQVVTQHTDDMGAQIRAKVIEIEGRDVSLWLETEFLGVRRVTSDATKLRKVE